MLCNTEFCSLCEKTGLLRVCFRVWFCKARKLPFQTGDFPAICGRTKYVQNKRKPQLAPASAEYPTLHRMGGTVGRHPGGSEIFPNAHTPPFRHAAKHFGRRLSANLIFRKQRAARRAAKRFGRRRTPAAPKFSRTRILRLFGMLQNISAAAYPQT